VELLKHGLVPALPTLPESLRELESDIQKQEASFHDLKPEAAARFVWHPDWEYQKSPYSLVYLHGFTASLGEGEPIHRTMAHRYGMNLFLPRIAGHGRGPDGFHRIRARHFVESAAHALAVGQAIGERVILMGTSTGAALALHLAAHFSNVHSLILYSPLIRFYRSVVSLIGRPSIQMLTKLALGGDYIQNKKLQEPPLNQVWDPTYRLEGLLALVSLVRRTMRKSTFQKIHQPTFLGYYYKSKKEQDQTVSVDAMLEMFDQLATPESKKRKVPFPEANAHVISSKYTSNSIEAVRKETDLFIHTMLDMDPDYSMETAITFVEKHPIIT
jgi:pimeloyl-ACP methyl ester carboxylesterase